MKSVIMPSVIEHSIFILVLALLLTAVSLRDSQHFTISSAIAATVAVVSSLKVITFSSTSLLMLQLLSAGILTMFLWLASEVYWRKHEREALGLGDVKLIGALTIWFGPVEIWSVLLVASIGAIAFGLMKLAKGQAGMHIPFGPFLSFAAVLQALLDLWSAA